MVSSTNSPFVNDYTVLFVSGCKKNCHVVECLDPLIMTFEIHEVSHLHMFGENKVKSVHSSYSTITTSYYIAIACTVNLSLW